MNASAAAAAAASEAVRFLDGMVKVEVLYLVGWKRGMVFGLIISLEDLSPGKSFAEWKLLGNEREEDED